MPPKLTIDAYHNLAALLDCQFIGDMPTGVDDPTNWQCNKCGRTFTLSHTYMRRYNKGCSKCSRPRKTAEDYINAAPDRFEWLATSLPSNIRMKTDWRCLGCNRVVSMRYADVIKSGHHCFKCGRRKTVERLRLTINDYKTVGLERSIQWVGDSLPKNNLTKTLWSCGQHTWEAMYNNIRKGSGCPYCAPNARITAEDYRVIGLDRSIQWLGDKIPKTSTTKTLWSCGRHTWQTSYMNIRDGCGCPHCNDMVNGVQVSKPQRELCAMLGGELNYRTDKHALDIVLFIDNLRICVEYDEAYWHYHKQNEDRARDIEFIERGWRILRIKSHDDSLPSRDTIEAAIQRLLDGSTYEEILLPNWFTYIDKREEGK